MWSLYKISLSFINTKRIFISWLETCRLVMGTLYRISLSFISFHRYPNDIFALIGNTQVTVMGTPSLQSQHPHSISMSHFEAHFRNPVWWMYKNIVHEQLRNSHCGLQSILKTVRKITHIVISQWLNPGFQERGGSKNISFLINNTNQEHIMSFYVLWS